MKVHRVAYLRRSLALAVLLGRTACLHGQSAQPPTPQIVLTYDHADSAHQRRFVAESTSKLVVKVGTDSFRLKRPASVLLKVVNTNTALYQFVPATKQMPAPSAQSFVQTVASGFGKVQGNAPALIAGFLGKGKGDIGNFGNNPAPNDPVVSDAYHNALSLYDDMDSLNSLIDSSNAKMGRATSLALPALTRMRTRNIDSVAREFRDTLNRRGLVKFRGPGRGRTASAGQGTCTDSALSVSVASQVESARTGVRDSVARMRLVLADNPARFTGTSAVDSFRTQLHSLLAWGDTVAERADSLLKDSRGDEGWITSVARACSQWRGEPVRITPAGGGQVLIVRIAPQSRREAAQFIDRPGDTLTVTILPPARAFEPKLGLTLLFAPNARFNTYSSRQDSLSKTNKIYVPNTKDGRLSWGLTLGAVARPLNWRNGSRGFAIWLPELTVGEASSQIEFGVGAAMSYGPVKLGVGSLWINHSVLNGLSVGQSIPNSGYLSTRDTYGHGNFYLSLSIFDLGAVTQSATKGGGGGNGQ